MSTDNITYSSTYPSLIIYSYYQSTSSMWTQPILHVHPRWDILMNMKWEKGTVSNAFLWWPLLVKQTNLVLSWHHFQSPWKWNIFKGFPRYNYCAMYIAVGFILFVLLLFYWLLFHLIFEFKWILVLSKRGFSAYQSGCNFACYLWWHGPLFAWPGFWHALPGADPWNGGWGPLIYYR